MDSNISLTDKYALILSFDDYQSWKTESPIQGAKRLESLCRDYKFTIDRKYNPS
jgi:hypothetical protein